MEYDQAPIHENHYVNINFLTEFIFNCNAREFILMYPQIRQSIMGSYKFRQCQEIVYSGNSFRANTVSLFLFITDMIYQLYSKLESLAWDTFVFMSRKREILSNTREMVIRERLVQELKG